MDKRKTKKIKKKEINVYFPIDNQKGIVKRSFVEVKTDYHKYREELRNDFWFSCAYCSITEVECCGIGFHIDHYLPKSSNPHLVNKYSNLMYSCQKCNSLKGSWEPNEIAIDKGYRVIKIDEEDPRDFFEVAGNELVAINETGNFNIELLELNRDSLKKIREIREVYYSAKEYIGYGIRKINRMSIDELNKQTRFQFNSIKKQINNYNERLELLTEEVLKNLARSPLLDEEKKRKEKTEKRRKYLKEIKAICYEI